MHQIQPNCSILWNGLHQFVPSNCHQLAHSSALLPSSAEHSSSVHAWPQIHENLGLVVVASHSGRHRVHEERSGAIPLGISVKFVDRSSHCFLKLRYLSFSWRGRTRSWWDFFLVRFNLRYGQKTTSGFRRWRHRLLRCRHSFLHQLIEIIERNCWQIRGC